MFYPFSKTDDLTDESKLRILTAVRALHKQLRHNRKFLVQIESHVQLMGKAVEPVEAYLQQKLPPGRFGLKNVDENIAV